jgi:ketosteroid isomerase-like protein
MVLYSREEGSDGAHARQPHETALTQLSSEWAAAELRGDTPFLQYTLADDFVGIGPRGFMLTKDQWLARHQPGDLKHESFTWDEVNVRLYGDAAVATSRQGMKGTYQVQEVEGRFRVSQVFVKQNVRWLLAAIQLSPMAGGP